MRQENCLPDGSIIGRDSLGIPDDIKLTAKEVRFIFWYTYPGSDAFMNNTKAALKAGYKALSATDIGSKMVKILKKPIQVALNNRSKANLETEYYKILEMKKRRVHFDIGDFVIEHNQFKDIAELTPEQRELVDGIDYKGKDGIPALILPNREREMRDIIEMYQKITGALGDTNSGYDVEATSELIKGKLQMKISMRDKKAEQWAGIFPEEPDGAREL
ncbi:hypothetical protein FACS1894172_15200 [Spirochaetia bacterium]|nr:hypothetical protein FACS1894164_04110 [Spirochaetia bacterium]GHU34642.1 hypothetical protein FACS1894172_15200 [Spirochaetia bacterium]